MTYDQLTEAQQERACIIWEGHYGCDESKWHDAIRDAVSDKETSRRRLRKGCIPQNTHGSFWRSS